MKNLRKIFSLLILGFVFTSLTLLITPSLSAESQKGEVKHEATKSDSSGTQTGLIALAVGLGMGIAAFGGALGQGKLAASALEGMARNPQASNKIFTPMILALAFIESLVLYVLVIAFILQGKM